MFLIFQNYKQNSWKIPVNEFIYSKVSGLRLSTQLYEDEDDWRDEWDWIILKLGFNRTIIAALKGPASFSGYILDLI